MRSALSSPGVRNMLPSEIQLWTVVQQVYRLY